MDNDRIVSRMNAYLHTSANVLAEWLGKLLPRVSENWWEECVLDKLSYNQRETARVRGFITLGEFDLAALLRTSTEITADSSIAVMIYMGSRIART